MARAHAASQAKAFQLHFSWRHGLVLAGFVVLLFGIVPQLGAFRRSLSLLKDADPTLMGIGLVLVVATFLMSSLIYRLLAFKPVRYGRTVLVEGASGFTNRALPAGVGGMGINAAYLHKCHHSIGQAAAVAITNNFVGFVGHFVLLGLVLLFYPLNKIHENFTTKATWLPYVLAVVLILVVVGVARYAKRLKKSIRRGLADFLRAFLAYGSRKRVLALALVFAMCNTLLTVGVLYVSCQAVDANVTFSSIFVAFTVGMVATSVTPTPGGLGGAEAGLVAGLVGFGVPAATALAATLLYRLLTYWLPILPGILLFDAVLRRSYVG